MTLEQARAHIGERVVYTAASSGRELHGEIRYVGLFAFVQYDGQVIAKATAADLLELETS